MNKSEMSKQMKNATVQIFIMTTVLLIYRKILQIVLQFLKLRFCKSKEKKEAKQ